MEVILYSKECNWYTRCFLLNGGVCYRECPLREAILYTQVEVGLRYMYMYNYVLVSACLGTVQVGLLSLVLLILQLSTLSDNQL